MPGWASKILKERVTWERTNKNTLRQRSESHPAHAVAALGSSGGPQLRAAPHVLARAPSGRRPLECQGGCFWRCAPPPRLATPAAAAAAAGPAAAACAPGAATPTAEMRQPRYSMPSPSPSGSAGLADGGCRQRRACRGGAVMRPTAVAAGLCVGGNPGQGRPCHTAYSRRPGLLLATWQHQQHAPPSSCQVNSAAPEFLGINTGQQSHPPLAAMPPVCFRQRLPG